MKWADLSDKQTRSPTWRSLANNGHFREDSILGVKKYRFTTSRHNSRTTNPLQRNFLTAMPVRVRRCTQNLRSISVFLGFSVFRFLRQILLHTAPPPQNFTHVSTYTTYANPINLTLTILQNPNANATEVRRRRDLTRRLQHLTFSVNFSREFLLLST